jgi:hypothetical protein
VERAVTAAAQDDEVLFAIRPQLAPPDKVVDLELISATALLTSPAITLKDLEAESAVLLCLEPKLRAFGKCSAHANRLIVSTNRCCCGAGRNLKNRSSDISSTSVLPFSRFAPARKSAQIISRQ